MVTFQSSRSDNFVSAYLMDDVDVMPQFPGGDPNLLNFINHNRKYPVDAYNNRVEGRVQCSFVVEPDGSISELSVFRGVCPSLDREAVRIIDSMPRWSPGMIDHRPVPVFYMLTIPFRL